MIYFNTEKEFIDYLKENKNSILVTEKGAIFCRTIQQAVGRVKAFGKDSL